MQIVKSKSFWAGLALVVTGVGQIVMGDVTEGIQTLGTGVVTIFLRSAIAKTSSN